VKQQTSVKHIARQRIEVLFKQAKKIGRSNPKLAVEYVTSARKIAMSAKIRMSTQFRRETCKACSCLFVQGINCRVRIKQKREPHIVVTCLNCGNQTRIPLKQKKEPKKLEQNNNPNETPC
jgi:ribonuclease P protein subunit RPR2